MQVTVRSPVKPLSRLTCQRALPSVWPLRKQDPLGRLRSNIVSKPPETPPRLDRFERADDQPARFEIPHASYSPPGSRKFYAPIVEHSVLDLGRKTKPGLEDEVRALIRGDRRWEKRIVLEIHESEPDVVSWLERGALSA